MTLSNRVIQFNRPVKNIKISYYGDPDVSVEKVSEIEKNASSQGYAKAEAFYKDQILKLQEKVAEKQQNFLNILQDEFKNFINTINNDLPSLVLAVAERVFAGVSIGKEIVTKVLQELTSEFSDSNEELIVHLCESDFKLMKSADGDKADQELPQESEEQDFSTALAGIFDSFDGPNDEEQTLEGFSHVKFVIDESLSSGDCVVKSRFGILDGRIETKLKRIKKELELT